MANNSLGRLTHLWLSCLLAASTDIWAPRLGDAGDGEHLSKVQEKYSDEIDF